MITHVVLFWANAPVEVAADKMLEGAKRLIPTIQGVRNFNAGGALSSPRGAVDDSFTFAISMDFADEEALQAYQGHPAHQEFIADYVKVHAARFLVYDIISG